MEEVHRSPEYYDGSGNFKIRKYYSSDDQIVSYDFDVN